MRLTVVMNRFPPHHAGGYGLRMGDVVRQLGAWGHRTSVVTSTAGVARPTVDAGGIHRILSLHGEIHGARGILALARATRRDSDRLRRALEAERPDVILVGNFLNLSSGLWPVLVEAPAPLVLDVSNTWLEDLAGSHGNWYRIWERPSRTRWAHALKTLLRGIVRCAPGLRVRTAWPGLRATRIYGTARHVAASVEEVLGEGDPRPGICSSGIDLDLFPFRPSSGPVDRLLYVGRLKRLKGVHTPIEALVNVPDCRLTIVGIEDDPVYAAELRSLADATPGRVAFRPAVPREALADVYSEHDALIFPTTGQEPFSRLILEAMSSGLPVIATPNGGTSEAVEDGVNGLLFAAGNAVSLAEQIHRLRQDDALRKELVACGRVRVEQRYGLDPAVRRIETVLLDAIREHGEGRP